MGGGGSRPGEQEMGDIRKQGNRRWETWGSRGTGDGRAGEPRGRRPGAE
jgi:hypothetical protein